MAQAAHVAPSDKPDEKSMSKVRKERKDKDSEDLNRNETENMGEGKPPLGRLVSPARSFSASLHSLADRPPSVSQSSPMTLISALSQKPATTAF